MGTLQTQLAERKKIIGIFTKLAYIKSNKETMKSYRQILLGLLLILSNQIIGQELDTLKTFDVNGNVQTLQLVEQGMKYNNILHYEYDQENRIVKEFMTDTLGNIRPRIGLSEIVVYEYSQEGDNFIETTFFFDGEMKPSINDRFGFHKIKTTFNSRRLKIEEWFFAVGGKTFERIGFKYNRQGLKSEVNYLDEDGALRESGLAVVTMEYDEAGNIIKKSNFDAQLRPYHSNRIPFMIQTNYLDGIKCEKYFDSEMSELKFTKFSNCDLVPGFQLPNQNGQLIEVNEQNGKIKIIHFWASWSPPSLHLNKRLVKLYKEIDKEEVEIISIALEKAGERAKWINAIQKTNLHWGKQLSDFKRWESVGAIQFGVQSIPTYFVIDENGFLIGNNLRTVQQVKEILIKKGKL